MVLWLAGVDIAMNTHLKNVKLILKGQSAQPLDSMSVRGNQIRYLTSHITLDSRLRLPGRAPAYAAGLQLRTMRQLMPERLASF